MTEATAAADDGPRSAATHRAFHCLSTDQALCPCANRTKPASAMNQPLCQGKTALTCLLHACGGRVRVQ